jgi:hypothetical protein
MSKFSLLLVIAASSEAFICPQNSSNVNENAIFASIGNKNWTMIATSDENHLIKNRPFGLPVDSNIQIMTNSFTTFYQDRTWQRLRFDLVCDYKTVKLTEFAKIYSKEAPKSVNKTICLYCYSDNIFKWQRIFISYNKFFEILMFYICDDQIEVLTVLGREGPLDVNSTKAQAENFLKKFKSNITRDNRLKFFNPLTERRNCESSVPDVCLKPKKTKKVIQAEIQILENEFTVEDFLVIAALSFGFALVLLCVGLVVVKVRKVIQKRRTASNQILFVRSNNVGVATIVG